jgi:hypothetical protein
LQVPTLTNAHGRRGAEFLEDLAGHEPEGAVDVEEIAESHPEFLLRIAAAGDLKGIGRQLHGNDGMLQTRSGADFFYRADFRIGAIVLRCILKNSFEFIRLARQKFSVFGVHASAFRSTKGLVNHAACSGMAMLEKYEATS